MNRDSRHKSLLTFVRRVIDVPLGYSKSDLLEFYNIALDQYPQLIHVITAYIDLAEKSETNVVRAPQSPRSNRRGKSETHLFDMLRDSSLFPTNTHLIEFAVRIMPDIPKSRFAKISRAEIAARAVEYLETLPSRTRDKLEKSMREAMVKSPEKESERESFISKWESIIKGT